MLSVIIKIYLENIRIHNVFWNLIEIKQINQILSKHPILINKIIKDLNFHNLEFSKRNIVRNMTLDYLSNYLKESRDMIRGLGKTPLTKIKRYVIDD